MATTAPTTERTVLSIVAMARRRLRRFCVEMPWWLQGPLVGLLYMALLLLPLPLTKYYWYLPAGFRFAALLFLPRRLWPWLILGEWATRWVVEVSIGTSLYHRMFTVFLQPLGSVAAVAWLRWKRAFPNLETPTGMERLIGAMLLSAALECLANVNFIVFVHDEFQHVTLSLPMFATTVFLGDFMGPLVIAPLLLALAQWRRPDAGAGRLALHALIGLVLPMIGFYLLETSPSLALARGYLRILIALPAVYLAFHYGWRGAAVALTLLSATVAQFHVQYPGAIPGEIAAVQMLLAVMGSGSLIFGATIDGIRNHRQQLLLQNAQLREANLRLEGMAGELRDAARRNLQLEEAQRRRIAIELHDELGQNLTALQTRVRLAVDDLAPEQNARFGGAIDGILLRMRQSLRGLMDTLRPAALDEFGLLRALREGPIRELLEHAGVVYRFVLNGEPALLDALDEDTRIAVWRMVQEAATNAVKHARAQRFDVALRIGLRHDSVWLVLDIQDDGIGLAATHSGRRGHGLQGMRDRMLALNGVFRITDQNPGTRLRVLLRQPLAAG